MEDSRFRSQARFQDFVAPRLIGFQILVLVKAVVFQVIGQLHGALVWLKSHQQWLAILFQRLRSF